MVGATGFEPATSCSQSKCSTRLSYAPTSERHPRRTRAQRNDYFAGSAFGVRFNAGEGLRFGRPLRFNRVGCIQPSLLELPCTFVAFAPSRETLGCRAKPRSPRSKFKRGRSHLPLLSHFQSHPGFRVGQATIPMGYPGSVAVYRDSIGLGRCSNRPAGFACWRRATSIGLDFSMGRTGGCQPPSHREGRLPIPEGYPLC
jgi:hypothetical protein